MKKEKSLSHGLIFGMKNSKSLLLLSAMAAGCCAAVIFVARAYNSPAPALSASATMQGVGRSRSRLNSRLVVNPQADRMRRRLGQRFISTGREMSSLVGTVTINGQASPVTITRRQDDDDEQVAISIAGGPQLNWNGRDGARQAGGAAVGDNRKLVERIALDSPDQFILAQLRAASYYTVAERVMPEEAAGSDSYDGPVWDVVRVGEPKSSSPNAPESPFRLYYINSSTGLIEKILSKEEGRTLTAEFSVWTQVNGEKLPARIVWKAGNQTVMELNLNNATHGPRQ